MSTAGVGHSCTRWGRGHSTNTDSQDRSEMRGRVMLDPPLQSTWSLEAGVQQCRVEAGTGDVTWSL